jgi:hypothetical protein
MDFGIAETGFARGSPPGTTTEVLRVGFPIAEIRFVSASVGSSAVMRTQGALPSRGSRGRTGDRGRGKLCWRAGDRGEIEAAAGRSIVTQLESESCRRGAACQHVRRHRARPRHCQRHHPHCVGARDHNR